MITRTHRDHNTGGVDLDYDLVNDVDSYKDSHPHAFPEGTTAMQSSVVDRVGAKFRRSTRLVSTLSWARRRATRRPTSSGTASESRICSARRGWTS